MRWKGRRQSDNIEDQRGAPSPGGLGGLGGLGARGGGAGIMRLLPMLFKVLGVKGTLIAGLGLVAFMYFSGGDLGAMLGGAAPGSAVQSAERTTTSANKPVQQSAEEKELVDFVSVVLADTEQTWEMLFRQMGRTYQEPRLVLYRDAVQSACGLGQAAMGPFYCPGDQKVYLDLSFFDDLRSRHDAPGDFAQAYVIAHEVGHHIQTLLGISSQVHQQKSRVGKAEANALSVRQELQADCFAGMWGYYANNNRQMLDPGDVEEGMVAAAAIGDDRLQKQARGYVSPESFTHGTSQQRVRWLKKGLEQGDLSACDTFAVRDL